MVFRRLRNQGVLADLHVAGEHPIVVAAAIRRAFVDRLPLWGSLSTVPILIEGLLGPNSRFLLVVFGVGALIFWATRAEARKAELAGVNTVAVRSDEAWAFLHGREGVGGLLWDYFRTNPFFIPCSLALLLGSLSRSFWLLLCAIPILCLSGRGLNQRLGSLDAAGFERLYTAWVLRENCRELFRELTAEKRPPTPSSS